ncbi:MAG: CvpA family protein [Clostridia bacterium]|nr:CvpA family protein [Clostridia bacterium]
MAIIIDLIIVAILAISIIIGYYKGLTKSLIRILSFVVAIIVAAVFFKPVSNLVIEHTEIDDQIRSSIVSLVQDEVKEDGEVKEESNLPNALIDYINQSIENAVTETKEAIVINVADTLTETIINVGVAILLFIITEIILLIVSIASDLITKLPVIKQFDKTGGVIYGIVRALVLIFVILGVFSLISPLIEGTGIIAMINKSFIGGWLYNNNLILQLIFKK